MQKRPECFFAEQTLCENHSHFGMTKTCNEVFENKRPPKKALTRCYQLPSPLEEAVGTITVGHRAMQFTVHKALMSDCSTFFKAAFESRFQESGTGDVVLQSERPSIVALMLEWVYTRRRALPALENAQALDALDDVGSDFQSRVFRAEASRYRDIFNPDGERNPALTALFQDDDVDLYILADRRGVQDLCDSLIHHFKVDRLEENPLLTSSTARVKKAYDELPENSPLLRYLEE